MNRPKYKELYLDMKDKYNETKYWTKYIMETLKLGKIIEIKREPSKNSFEDLLVIRAIPNREELFIAIDGWGLDLIEEKEN